MSFQKIECRVMYPVGKVFVALNSKDEVVNAILVKAAFDSDFKAFCDNARTTLSALGRVIYGEMIHEDGSCFFIKREATFEAEKKKRISVDLNSDWKQYQPVPMVGWEFTGVVSLGDQTGALGRNIENNHYSLVINNTVVALDPKKVRAALYKITGIKTPELDKDIYIDLNSDWKQYQPVPMVGWEFTGVVSRGDQTGALGRNIENNHYSLVINNKVVALESKKVRSILKKLQLSMPQ